MSKSILKNAFQSLIGSNPDAFQWFTNSPHHGVWYCRLDDPSEFYISNSLFATLGYDVEDGLQTSDHWDSILGTPGRHTLKQLITDAGSTGILKNKYIFSFLQANGKPVVVKAKALLVEEPDVKHLLLKFTRKFTKKAQIDLYEDKIKRLRAFSEIYEESNELAQVGGWEVDLVNSKISWTPYIHKIHEVPLDYVPQLDSAIGFFKEGWSRDTITRCFQEAAENGTPYDEELIIVAADGTEKWVRSLAKAEMKNGQCLRVYGAFQDITEVKKHELAKEEAEHRFKEIFSHSAIGIVLVRKTHEVFMVNLAARKIFGLENVPKSDFFKYTLSTIVKPEYLDEAIRLRKQLISGTIDSYKMIAECYHASGATIWCSFSCSIFDDALTGGELVITQVEDITNQKKLELSAQKSSLRFKRVFENSPNGMAVVDLHGDWVLLNKNLAQMVGYTRDELLQLKVEQITHEEDRGNDLNLFSDIINKKIDSYQIEKRYIHKSGRLVYCYLTVSGLYDENGHITSLIGQVVDMTETIMAKKELQSSLNDLQVVLDATTQVVIIETDLNHKIKKFNKGAENLLGYKAEEVVDIHVPKIFHVEKEVLDYKKCLEEKYNVKIAQNDVFTYAFGKGDCAPTEWTYVKKDGNTFKAQLITSGVYDENGTIKGYLGVATDISGLKEMEESLRNAKQKAEAASKSKSEFLANMSHEIRTPLNGVIGFTDLILKTDLDENQRQYSETAYSSAVSLLDLINDILDFSKIEAGKLELSKERVDIAEVCSKTVDMIKQQAHKKGLEVLLNIPNDLDNYILGDSLRLRQILLNLMSNAVKFTHQGEIELKVTQEPLLNEADKIRYHFSLRDTGIGIAPQNLQKIFNAFDQEDSSTTRKYGGTGLGLTISNKLLGLMDSKLKVESELGVGTTFSFYVDFSAVENDLDKTDVIRTIKHVLVVDDNTNNRIIIEEMLRDRAIKTTQVSNGVDAIEILEQDTNFDLAIIDYHMPYLNGLDLIRHLRKELNISRNQLPVIMMHSSGQDQVIADGSKDLDVDKKIVKPILRDQLLEYLDSLESPQTIQVENAQPTERVETLNSSIDLAKLKLRILVAEDNPVNKFLTHSILNKVVPQAELIEAENGAEAVAAYKKHKLDLILMDIQMPVLSGIEATEAIRKMEREDQHIPIIALTARAIKGERERCLTYGMDDYVSKPIVIEDLKKCILNFVTEESLKPENIVS